MGWIVVSIFFLPDYCIFKSLSTKQIIGKGRESGGLYVFKPTMLKAMVGLKSLSLFELHCCLGHPSFKVWRNYIPNLVICHRWIVIRVSLLNISVSIWSLGLINEHYYLIWQFQNCVGGDIPFLVMFSNKYLFHIKSKVFGCSCFVRGFLTLHWQTRTEFPQVCFPWILPP